MKVVILCGGLGTRLREDLEYRPKPLVEIGHRPILWHIMKLYAHHGFHEFVLCLGYRGHMIKEYFLHYEATSSDFTLCLGDKRSTTYHDACAEEDFRVTLADTGLNTMTGGRIKRIERYVPEPLFMVTYGDGVADLDIRALYKFHRDHGRLATLTAVRPPARYGIVDLDEESRVVRFREKPASESWISGGFFVFDRRVFDLLGGDNCVLEREPLERLAREGQLMAYRHDGFFFAMDTYREYRMLNDMWDSGNAPWRVWT
jgi:glucose-1-phosphate cytidylyltransferase